MTSLIQVGWSTYRWILDLFIPPRCIVCERVGTWLCETCALKIPLLEGPFCPRCGRPLKGEGICRSCHTGRLKVAPIYAAFLFGGEIRDVIHALKYRGARSVAPTLAKRMTEAWHRYELSSDVLIPVPLHPQRERQRGYNQAALLSKALGQEIGIPVEENGLSRIRNTQSQTQLNRKERQENVSGAFAWNNQTDLIGAHVTLIDDVVTTGSTLNACATILLEHGVQSVNAFTLARAS